MAKKKMIIYILAVWSCVEAALSITSLYLRAKKYLYETFLVYKKEKKLQSFSKNYCLTILTALQHILSYGSSEEVMCRSGFTFFTL